MYNQYTHKSGWIEVAVVIVSAHFHAFFFLMVLCLDRGARG